MSVTERKYLAIAIMFSLCAVFAGLLAGLAVAKYAMTAFMLISTGACGWYVFGWAFDELFGEEEEE